MRMVDHRGRRIAASLLLAVLALAGGGPLVHACPHHDGGVVSSSIDHAPTEHAAHAGHAPLADDSPSEEHGPCTCIDSCHGSSLAPMPSLAGSDIRLAPRDAGAPGLIPATREPAPAPPSYLLPYPNGPPGSA